MAACRVCGVEIREGDDIVAAHDEILHLACVDAPKEGKRRKLGAWVTFGSRGQNSLGAVQKDRPF